MSNTLPTIIPRSEHTISRKHISQNALKVLYRLHESGFRGCLVGGGVRDLLLGLRPKDFDVATDATPEEIRGLFNNARIIGRRFRLVHIRYGREVIEVATFRGSGLDNTDSADDADQSDEQDTPEQFPADQATKSYKKSRKRRFTKHDAVHSVDDEGFVTRDNVYGTIEEDAVRRDLTINALYYDIADFSVIDYCGGVKDIENKTIKLIGDPLTRYKEDPVRMLRVLRFATKLGFEIDPQTDENIRECCDLLSNIPPARLVDESLKMFMSGCAATNYALLEHYNLLDALFPFTKQSINETSGNQRVYFEKFIALGLANSDDRVAHGQTITPYYLLAVLFWPAVISAMQPLMATGQPFQDALFEASDALFSAQQQHISLPKRYSTPMREVWAMQPRLEKSRGKRATSLMSEARFRAAYDFLILRATAGEDIGSSVSYWTKQQDILVNSIDSSNDAKPSKKSSKPRKKRASRKADV